MHSSEFQQRFFYYRLHDVAYKRKHEPLWLTAIVEKQSGLCLIKLFVFDSVYGIFFLLLGLCLYVLMTRQNELICTLLQMFIIFNQMNKRMNFDRSEFTKHRLCLYLYLVLYFCKWLNRFGLQYTSMASRLSFP